MHHEHSLAAMLRGEPFMPFEIHAGDETFRVVSREMVMVDPSETVAVVFDPSAGVTLIQIDHISSCTRRTAGKAKRRPESKD